MTKLHKKKANIFGKKVPVLLLALVLVAGIGSAALLSFYGTITGSATVEQGLSIDDHAFDDPVEDGLGTIYSNAGGTSIKKHSLINDAGEDSEVVLEKTDCDYDGDYSGKQSCDNISTRYYGFLDTEVSFYEDNSNEDVGEPKYESWTLKTDLSGDTVSYIMDFPRAFNSSIQADNVDLEIDRDNDGVADFHIKYQPIKAGDSGFDDRGFTVKLYEDGSITENVKPAELDYVSASVDGSVVTFNVEGKEQKFEILGAMGNDDDGYNDDFIYPGETEYFGDADGFYLEELSQSVTVPAEESVDFAVVNEYPQGMYPGNYTVTTEAGLADE